MRDKTVALPILGLRRLCRHGGEEGADDRIIAGNITTLDDRRHQSDQRVEGIRTQSHRTAEQGARRSCPFLHHVTDIAPQLGDLAALERVPDNIRLAGQSVFDTLWQQHQIAVLQFLPSLGFGMDPAWPLTDEMKAKQLLLRKGDAPWMTQLAATVVDSTQAKVS